MKSIPNLQHLQKDPAELEACKKNPLYFYNMYMRQEGEKVLSQEEFDALNKIKTRSNMLLNEIAKNENSQT